MRKIWINVDDSKVDISLLRKELGEAYEVVADPVATDDKAGLLSRTADADAVICGLEIWDRDVIRQVKGKVGLIQKYGMGLDNIDIQAATENKIAVANVIGANSVAVAEVALLHILNVLRRFTPCVAGVKKHIWPSTLTGPELDGKTVGLLGFGNIAQNLARMLTGFRVDILTYDPFVKTVPAGLRASMVDSPEELFRRSDIVSVHIPCTPETEGSVNSGLISLMKPGSYLINTSRGKVLDEPSVLAALRSGQLAAVGLDVLYTEPPLEDTMDMELIDRDNVFVTSHMGAESVESGQRSQIIMSDTIKKFFSGEYTRFVVNRDKLA